MCLVFTGHIKLHDAGFYSDAVDSDYTSSAVECFRSNIQMHVSKLCYKLIQAN